MQINYQDLLKNTIRPVYIHDVWNVGFKPLFPFVTQDFPIRSLMPTILYLMRWSKRRGKGEFFKKFHNEHEKSPSAKTVANYLADNSLTEFDNEIKKDILSDALIAFCLENRKRSSNTHDPIIRAYPTHYFSSWIDLPVEPAHLRDVPETIVSVLVKQNKGSFLRPDMQKGYYKTMSGFRENLLLELYGNGVYIEGDSNNKSSDKFDERTDIGIDELLTIRIAQSLENAPLKAMKNDNITNIHPVAKNASRYFFEDFNIFIRNYYNCIPRLTITPMIETCISTGITNMYLALADIAVYWLKAGKIKEKSEQYPVPLFIDCSRSSDRRLRSLSENTMEEIICRISKLPLTTMIMKILTFLLKEVRLTDIPDIYPDPTEYLNYLGDLFYERTAVGKKLTEKAEGYCNSILSEMPKTNEEASIIEVLKDQNRSPVQRLAEATIIMMGNKLQNAKFLIFLDNAMLANDANHMCLKRKTTLNNKSAIRRSVNLSNNALEYLVLRHLKKDNNRDRELSLINLMDIMKNRYGYYIAESPEGHSFSSLDLRNNRGHFEKQLRDLGLFTGVNDSESMKRLKSRFDSNNIGV